jgi:hypothetical protein
LNTPVDIFEDTLVQNLVLTYNLKEDSLGKCTYILPVKAQICAPPNLVLTKGESANNVFWIRGITNGQYTFKFYTNGALDSTKNYNGFVQCAVPITLGMPTQETASIAITVFPNPSSGQFNLRFSNPTEQKEVRAVDVYNLQGALLYHSNTFQPIIETKNWGKGIYLLHLQLSTRAYHQKLMIQ